MANKRCSCGKTTLINPNAFQNQDRINSSPVQLEDLSIYVELTTHKKARSILLTSKQAGTSTTEEEGSITVNFIEGANVGGTSGKKYLTTSFTELTTSLDNKPNKENLGITSIDIDFNSSYAPMVTINFIDLRGSSIFQNDEYIKDGSNPYSVFFKLPYPLYTLKIKGYYGLPVEYCLHMTKFTSRFNSQTGNFEITCSFVGYTYAMLSDMLIGVLKAIPNTSLGRAKYAALQLEDPTLLTLDGSGSKEGLVQKLEQINVEANRILSTDTNYTAISDYKKSLEKLKSIRDKIDFLGLDIDADETKTIDKYDYFIIEKAITTEITKYNTDVTTAINDYNTFISNLGLAQLNINTFTPLKMLNANTTYKTLKATTGHDEITKYIEDKGYLNGSITDVTPITIYDNKEIYKTLDKQLNTTNENIESLKKTVAQTLKDSVAKSLGFEPTVRNIIKTFTTAVEVYLSCMYDVSKTAQSNPKRKDELVNKFKPGNNDYKNLKEEFYPWPTYINKDDGIEEYLGKAGVLDNPNNVDEIRFIEDLFRAFLITYEQEKNFDALIKESNTNWYSVNPLDTSLFNDISPYKREEPKKPKDIADMVMIRAMIFLGFSNINLTDDEITNFAVKEAESILNGAQNPKLIDGFANTYCLSGTSGTSALALIDVNGNINNVDKKVIEKNGTNYYYNYIGDTGYIDKPTSEFKKIFPIKKGFFDADWTDITKQIDDGNLLLSNYQTAVSLTNPKYKFERNVSNLANSDGGTYIKLIDRTSFDSKAINSLVSPPPTPYTDITMNLEELKKFVPDMKAAGFNIFAGAYGVQQYTSLKYGVPELDDNGGLPFRFMFIADSIGEADGSNPNTYNKSNGFGLKLDTQNSLVPLSLTNLIKPTFNNQAFNSISEYTLSVDGVKRTQGQYETKAIHKKYGFNRGLIKEYINGNKNVTYPYVNFQIEREDYIISNVTAKDLAPFSLFGSRLYYEQKTPEAKAFLFLHSLPWNGLANSKLGTEDTLFNSSKDVGFEILNVFSKRAGFISVPKLWPAFIGGLIWRYESQPDPIIFYNDDAEAGFKSLIPIFIDKHAKDVDYIPKKSDYLTISKLSKGIPSVMSFSNKKKSGENYKQVDKVILTLPEQAKDEFKKAFFDFVNGDFQTLRGTCEIYDGNTWLEWKNLYDSVMSTSPTGALSISNGTVSIKEDVLKSKYKNVDNYFTFSPIVDNNGTPINGKDAKFKYSIFLEFKDGSPAAKLIMDLLTAETFIVNTSPNIWDYIVKEKKDNNVNPNQNPRKNIEVPEVTLKKYLEKFISAMNPTGRKSTNDEQKKQAEQNLFGTTDENVIKFMLYKSCKNIYDKWIGNVDNDKIMFQCGGRGPVDTELAKKRGVSEPKLIDSFRFVTRSFTDIGDKLAINPLPVADFLKNNSNTSFYAAVTSLLSSNNFDFIALPNFINYNKPEKLEQVFEPYDFSESVDGCGPSFVCVYLGERSKNLDFDSDSDSYDSYINDGFDIICDENGTIKNIPKDFVDTQQGDEPISVFNVTFGQQNQNIFKDITLDQSEFGETAESLKIMDDISNRGSETNNTLAGQNIYNVYSVRSYKVEIEMMGDAMIQPMMYFQLNNIPMFHGAYMITHVKHSIKPNHMSTNFTGVRIRKPETKIFDLGELYMSMLDTMNVLQSNSSTANNSFGSGLISANCGSFSVPNIVDGATGFEKSKPIRDLVATVESLSSGLYDAYNNGTAGGTGDIKYTPSIMTLDEIRAAQALTGINRLFAVGKYQITPPPNGPIETFINYALTQKDKNGNLFTRNSVFNAELQEVCGEWLIFKKRSGLMAYFANGSLGTEEDLQKAITDLALEFASFPLYHMSFVNNNQKPPLYEQPIGYNSTQAAYAGQGGNLGTSKFCAQDVAKALIQTWKNLNPNKTPKFDYPNLVNRNVGASSTTTAAVNTNDCDTSSTKITFSVSSTSVIIGDSTVGVLDQVPNGLKDNKIDIGYNCVGKTVTWLNKQLPQDKKVYRNVKHVFVAIGTNDGYDLSSTKREEIKTLDSLISSKFPNALKSVVAGTRGWENVKNITQKRQDEFYNMFEDLGWVYLWSGPNTGNQPRRSSYFDDVNKAHNPKDIWFIGLMDEIRIANNKQNTSNRAKRARANG
jgi:hypothetical protein